MGTRCFRMLWAIAASAALCLQVGCVGSTATLLYWLRGAKVEAEFDGLEDKRVAVVCVSDASSYGQNTSAEALARFLELSLRSNVQGIDVVRQDDVLDWIDNNDWDQIDFSQIGRGVEAEMLLAVEVSGYSLTNGKTLYQGRADITVSVYDIGDDARLVFRKTLPQYEYPKNGGQPATDTTRGRFEEKFLYMLSEKIANYFYDYEMITDFSQDAAVIGE